jgi:XTP/dITP diphosphohydrolase
MKKIFKIAHRHLITMGNIEEIKDLLPKYIKTYSTSEFKLKSPKRRWADIHRKLNHKI